MIEWKVLTVWALELESSTSPAFFDLRFTNDDLRFQGSLAGMKKISSRLRENELPPGFSRGLSRPGLPWALAQNFLFCQFAFLSFTAIKRKEQRKITAYENSLKILVIR